MTWSPQQYAAFEDERTRPVRDLLQPLAGKDVRRAIDLGCGPGNSTEVLAASFPRAEVSGLDNSPAMIEAARKRLPDISFELRSVVGWRGGGSFDLILSNAVLQWTPDHEKLFPQLVEGLARGGSLAVQMPDNLDEPAQTLMRDTAAEPPWSATLANLGEPRTSRHSAEWYYRLLKPLCARVDVWRTTYFHALAGVDAVVEWFKGSGLRPFLTALSEREQETYLARYREKLEAAYPVLPDGVVLLPFPRLFMIATR